VIKFVWQQIKTKFAEGEQWQSSDIAYCSELFSITPTALKTKSITAV
jgi:hypothetical protein